MQAGKKEQNAPGREAIASLTRVLNGSHSVFHNHSIPQSVLQFLPQAAFCKHHF
jgi:hypothetical protein